MRHLFVALAALFLSSCSVMAVKKHDPNFKNVRKLESVAGRYHVAEITAPAPELQERIQSTALTCRLTTFNMPAGKTVADFVRDALTDELDAARKLDANGTPVAIVVKKLESDTSGFNRGKWTLEFDYIVGKKTVNVKTETEFESAYMAATACRNTGDALTDALGDNFMALYGKLKR